jgi:hypothetical protein
MPGTNVLTTVAAVGAGQAFTCALMWSTGVRCWGWAASGVLGDGTTTDRNSPLGTDIPGLTGVTKLAAGQDFVCVLNAAGDVTCWGNNFYGECLHFSPCV